MENNTSAAPKKNLTWLDVWAMAFGCMVGWGAFVMVISVVLSLIGRNTLGWFVDLTSFGAIVGFGCTSAAVLQPENKN